ncbi:hypothetical protein [Bifidobacterium oedipodis]|uniref:Uncharacterized protein n=1 Tax=Bifidobacterium oedipodis TaxID=2675322 RepID=A0A7Y0EP98_9BIFI|nr:hypothetical protein [Bifidobacterium sp. DSM 109957]NMM93910.1 hypothetical protein [Bifidobacterium sp. DSM 109957]
MSNNDDNYARKTIRKDGCQYCARNPNLLCYTSREAAEQTIGMVEDKLTSIFNDQPKQKTIEYCRNCNYYHVKDAKGGRNDQQGTQGQNHQMAPTRHER